MWVHLYHTYYCTYDVLRKKLTVKESWHKNTRPGSSHRTQAKNCYSPHIRSRMSHESGHRGSNAASGTGNMCVSLIPREIISFPRDTTQNRFESCSKELHHLGFFVYEALYSLRLTIAFSTPSHISYIIHFTCSNKQLCSARNHFRRQLSRPTRKKAS